MGKQRRIRHARKHIRDDLQDARLTLEDAYEAFDRVKEAKVWYCPHCQKEGTAEHTHRGILTLSISTGQDE